MRPTSIRLLPAVALAALAVAPALPPAPVPSAGVAGEIVFTGRVTDAATGGGVVGARVELRPAVARAVTDRSGEYAFSVPAERLRGTGVALSATKLGYETAERRVRVDGDTVRVDFALQMDVLSLEGLVVTGADEEVRRARAEPSAKPFQDFTGVGAAQANAAARKGGLPPDWNTESYDRIYDNQFIAVSTNPLSTFAIDVDRASYSNVRRFITQGQLPPKDAVRIEELINYFPYDYAEPRGEHPFAVTTEVAAAPWQPQHRLVRIGLQAKRIDTRNLPPANLVFLLDVSGSMQSADKLPLLKSSLRLLVAELRPEDRVAIVVYAGAAGLVLPPTAGSDKETILDAIGRLEAGGSTAGGAGIRLAYDVAQRNFRRGANNRVIFATDGDFNIGASSDAEMTRLIEEKREGGVFLTVLGFGTGNLKDAKMEALADHGNGNYAYIDGLMEAKKTLVHELGGTLLTVAKDVKLQLEFNPARVRAYRLIGYENRLLRDEDFNDDRKDAGEMGAGHSVTALYEIIPVGVRSPVRVGDVDTLRYQRPQGRNGIAGGDELLYVKLRYKQPDGERSRLFSQALRDGDARPSADFAFATAVAEFGMLLRDSEFKACSSLEHVVETARRSRGDDPQGYRAEFVRLAEAVRALGLPDEGIVRGR